MILLLEEWKKNYEEWVLGRSPNCTEKKKMIANAIGIGVRAVMSNHTYMVGDKVFLQSEGCPIGLDLSQGVARAVMLLYDELYQEQVKNEGINLCYYSRYVDDSNQIVESDENEKDIVNRLKAIANRLLEGIVMDSVVFCAFFREFWTSDLPEIEVGLILPRS